VLTTKQIIKKYGQPGESNLVYCYPAYPMRVAWDKKVIITKFKCHRLVKNAFEAAFKEVLSVYGLQKIQELELDLFGGCYNFRLMRGGKDWSKHSWGIALDTDPEHNQLKWGRDRARMARPEYKAYLDIMDKHGFVSLGRAKNYDWMHVEVKA
jgi:hypothetical protein